MFCWLIYYLLKALFLTVPVLFTACFFLTEEYWYYLYHNIIAHLSCTWLIVSLYHSLPSPWLPLILKVCSFIQTLTISQSMITFTLTPSLILTSNLYNSSLIVMLRICLWNGWHPSPSLVLLSMTRTHLSNHHSPTYVITWVGRSILHLGWVSVPSPNLHQSDDVLSSSANVDKYTGWRDPSCALATAAYKAGSPFMLNELQKSNKDMNHNYVFRCASFHRTTRTTPMELTDDYQYRNTSLLNDRRNNRKQGQHCPKHINTIDRRGSTCWFQFILKWDLDCFYINLQQKAGHLYHTSHPKVLNPTSILLPTNLPTSNQIKETLHVVKSTSNNGSG